ncbi:hypothetical protein Tsubulata_033810 [Turnera subulata]|uniref:Ricin B lectin domain-containing protein n=1 Tax=Turnera subulata TaxID=218843 RepID=A0A9Q0JFJ2_9ROSI|nr:hypothetical protein Tsubulata_033810 [Turnera subulata]
MMMKLSEMAWVCLILVLVVWAPIGISGVEQQQQEDPKLSGPLIAHPSLVIQQVVGGGGEDKVHLIRGPKGLCIEVPGGDYKNGTEVILSPCNSTSQNQQWTIEEDGRVRSNNYCLRPKNGCPVSPPNYLMIETCPDDPSGSWAQWEYSELFNGLMKHTKTGLVLTAKSDVQGQSGVLTVDIDKCLPSQAWMLDEGPSDQRLQSGANSSCLTLGSDNYTVELGDCENSTTNVWEVIKFSSVGNNGKCLSCQDDNGQAISCKNGSRIVALDCCVGLPSQSWRFDQNHFSNRDSELYLTLADSGDDIHVIAAPAVNESDPNQLWNLI